MIQAKQHKYSQISNPKKGAKGTKEIFWGRMGPNHHKHSQIIRKKKGKGAKGTKGVLREIMHPNQIKYSQISDEKKKKGA
jgi:hypothetical protein